MTIEEQRAYLEHTLRKSPEGSARRIWAAAQLAQLHPKPKPVITRGTAPKQSHEELRPRAVQTTTVEDIDRQMAGVMSLVDRILHSQDR